MPVKLQLFSVYIALLCAIACSDSTIENAKNMDTYTLKQKIEGNENILLQYKYIPVIGEDTQDF